MDVYGFPTEEKVRRAEAWVVAWRSMQASTERVDQERAQAALSALYAERQMAPPDFLWVDHPTDALLAWHLVSHGRTPLRNPHTKGDWGTGDDRALYQLHDPFGLEPVWTYRAMNRARSLAPQGSPGGFTFDGGYSANGETLWSLLNLRLSFSAMAERRANRGQPARMLQHSARTEMLSRLILGRRFGSLAELIGTDRTIDVALRAVLRAAEDLLDVEASRREALRALTFPAYDQLTIAMGALPDVLGVALWRQLDERAERTAMVERRLELARTGVAFMALEGLAIMLDRPTATGFDERGRLHATNGPALEYPDGTTIWADHGVQVPEDVVTDPEAITVERIDAQSNAEVRRVMTERFGAERLIREGDAELLHADETGRLWRRGFRRQSWQEESVVMVEVVNSTSEPDGTYRTYFLRVPPDTRTAREAVAWTFGLGGNAYAPVAET